MTEQVELKIEFVHGKSGWFVIMRYPDGSGHVSNERYQTREECEAAFEAWRIQAGIPKPSRMN